MNQKIMKQYILFAVSAILIGLIVCEIICSIYPEMDKYHSGDNKYLCVAVLGITGLVLRYLLTTKMGEENLYSEPTDRLNREIGKINAIANNKIAAALASTQSVAPPSTA
jgi:hypothetical protein